MTHEQKLQTLLEYARQNPMTPQELSAARRSFAYGNTKIDNDKITKAMIVSADEELLGH